MSLAEPFARIERAHVLAALARIDAGAKTPFAKSIKYDLVYKGRRYSPKEVAGLAIEELTKRPASPKDFKGGLQSSCFAALRRSGFTIVPKRYDLGDETIASAARKILSLQERYVSGNTPEMALRGTLVRKAFRDLLYDRIELIEDAFSEKSYQCQIEGSDGVGRKSRSPWVRIFDPDMSPSATSGWYVVFHFVGDGSAVLLALGCGATKFHLGSLVPVDDAELAAQVAWAKQRLANFGLDVSRFNEIPDLKGNSLSEQYEKAIALCRSYTADDLDRPEFWSDLKNMCSLLVELYESDRLRKSPYINASEGEEGVGRSTSKSGRGQGRGLSSDEKKAVEQYAMQMAEDHLQKQGFQQIRDTSIGNPYDFRASRDGLDWYIEVKGTTSSRADSFQLTANELELHRQNFGRTVLILCFDIELSEKDGSINPNGGKIEMLCPWDHTHWELTATQYLAKRVSVA